MPDCLCTIITSIPLQLLAYHIAINKGCNVDMPRNQAKSVTVKQPGRTFPVSLSYSV